MQIIRNKEDFPVSVTGFHTRNGNREFNLPFTEIRTGFDANDRSILITTRDGSKIYALCPDRKVRREFFDALAQVQEASA